MTSMSSGRTVLALLTLLASLGCDAPVVEDDLPSLGRLATVVRTETLIPPSGDDYDLYNATHLSSFSDGGIAVLNAGTPEVLVFTSTGRLQTRFGGPGQGPGEFSRPTFLTVTPGDSVLVTDLLSQRVVVFDRGGRPARTYQLETPSIGELYVFPFGLTEDNLLVTAQGVTPIGPNAAAGPVFLPARVLAYDPEGAISEVVERPGISSEFFLFEQEGRLRSIAPPFRRRTVIAGGGSGVALATSLSRSILLLDAGIGAEVTIPFPGDTPPLSRSVADSALSAWVDSAGSSEDRILRRRLVADMPSPTTPPVLDDLQFDLLGRLWVAASGPNGGRDSKWYVIDEQSAIGFIELPRSVQVMEIGQDYVLGIEADALDLQSVVKLYLSWE
jgi:hypothetical protein